MTPSGDRFLDHWRTLSSPAGQHLLSAIHGQLDSVGAQKPRRPDQKAAWRELVEVMAANLVLTVLDPPASGWLVTPINCRNSPKRYRNSAVGKALPGLLRLLHAAGLIDTALGRRQGREATTIRPTSAVAALVSSHRVTYADLGWSAVRGDPLVLTRRGPKWKGKCSRHRVDYAETGETEALRQQMGTINAALARADLAFEDDGRGRVDLTNRWTSRRFTVLGDQPERFDQVGRVFGGFWQTLPKDRRAGLRINGEPCVTVDYSSMFTRIAFGEAGVTPPIGDLYSVPELADLGRDQRKAAFNVFLFTRPGITRWPKALFDPELGGSTVPTFPPRWTTQRVRRAILAHHPCLAAAFNSDTPQGSPAAGFRLMFLESLLLVTLLDRMASLSLVGLPLHDAVVVQASKVTQVEALMLSLSQEVIGCLIPVSLS